MAIIAVGSTNPVKKGSVEDAFKRIWPERGFVVYGYDVASEVAAQPMTAAEGLRGAINRAHSALANSYQADYSVGLEGCLEQDGPGGPDRDDNWSSFGWVIVLNRDGRISQARSLSLPISPKVIHLVRQGMEVGEADDQIFQQTNSKQGQSSFGLVTNGLLTRQGIFTDALIAALAPFLHPELY